MLRVAVSAAVYFLFPVNQTEGMHDFLLNACDASRVFASYYIFEGQRKL